MTSGTRRDLIWGAVCLALLLYFLGASNDASEGLREWRSSAGLAVRAGKPFRDSLATLAKREAALQRIVRSSRARVETLFAKVPKDSISPSLLLVLAEQTRALDACEDAVVTCGLRAHLASARADSLEDLLRKGLVATKCKILIAPCPSRGVVFIGGGIVGVLLSGAVK